MIKIFNRFNKSDTSEFLLLMVGLCPGQFGGGLSLFDCPVGTAFEMYRSEIQSHRKYFGGFLS